MLKYDLYLIPPGSFRVELAKTFDDLELAQKVFDKVVQDGKMSAAFLDEVKTTRSSKYVKSVRTWRRRRKYDSQAGGQVC